MSSLRVSVVTSYPVTAAATRFRFHQMVEPLRARGIELEILPLLDEAAFARLYDPSSALATAGRMVAGVGRRLAQVPALRRADVVVVFREATLAGPPLVEWLTSVRGGPPLVLDLDDATFVAYDSPTYGRLGRLAKWPGKADTLIDRARLVTCGNDHVARYVEGRGRPARLVPTVVDTDVFRPGPPRAAEGPPVVGWVGTHSTYPYLEAIFRTLAEVARERPFRLVVSGSTRPSIEFPGLSIEARTWSLDREVADFQSLDIGLYPLPDDEWTRGKSGLKSIQYLACGVPFVASPVGVVAELGAAGETHLLATTAGEWRDALTRLLDDPAGRRAMGDAGRAYALRHYTLDLTADALAAALREAAQRR